MTGLLFQIFVTFFLIGMFNFGGGGAMLSLIQDQVVGARGWLSDEVFTNVVAISQTTPGPIGINCATYVGYEVMHSAGYGAVAGVFGSALATLAVVLPSFIIFFILIKLFDRFHTHPVFVGTMRVLRPASAGLIAAAAVILTVSIHLGGAEAGIRILTENFPDWTSWVLAAGAFIASYFFKANPIWVILAAGALGLVIY